MIPAEKSANLSITQFTLLFKILFFNDALYRKSFFLLVEKCFHHSTSYFIFVYKQAVLSSAWTEQSQFRFSINYSWTVIIWMIWQFDAFTIAAHWTNAIVLGACYSFLVNLLYVDFVLFGLDYRNPVFKWLP